MNLADRRRTLGALLALGLLVPGCKQAAPPVPEEVSKAPVKVAAARRVPLAQWTELIGTTYPLPDHAARVSAALEGHVEAVLGEGSGKAVVEGQRVEKGQVIVQLDDRAVRANRDKALAMLDELKEQRQQADLTEKVTLLDLERLGKLQPVSGSGAVPLVSRIELEKARLLLQDAQSKQRGAEARLQAARAELKVIEVHLDQHRLRAPIAGWLGTLQVVPGQTLSPGTAVADVLNLDQIDVLCNVSPHLASRLVLGQPARLASQQQSAGAKSAPAGKVVYIAVQGQPDTGNFPVKVRFSNLDLRLRANSVLRIDVLTQPEKERLTLPEAALLEDQDPPAVIAVQDVKTEKNADGKEERIGKARKLRATLGVRDRARHLVEVLRLEDAEKNEAVAIDGILVVTEGAHGLENDDLLKLETTETTEKRQKEK